jgi:hypothetical protein
MYHFIRGFHKYISQRTNLKLFIMKSTALIWGACILVCLNSRAQDFKKLNDSELDSKKVQIAKNFAIEFLSNLKNGSYYHFKDEAIDLIKTNLAEENQKALYQQLKDQLGDFQTLDYAETWIQSTNSSLKVFRFKGDFDKSNKKVEIRVVLNESDKIAGFWVRPWSDMFK